MVIPIQPGIEDDKSRRNISGKGKIKEVVLEMKPIQRQGSEVYVEGKDMANEKCGLLPEQHRSDDVENENGDKTEKICLLKLMKLKV